MGSSCGATNRTVAASRAMWEGSFKDTDLQCSERWDSSWEKSGPLQRRVVENIFKVQLKLCASDGMP